MTVPYRYEEKIPGENNYKLVEEGHSQPLGVPIKVSRPLKRGGFETVMTDTLSNAKYMEDYVKWYEKQGGGDE